MGNARLGESADMFDPNTGTWLGVVDQRGRETYVPTLQTDPLTGGMSGLVGPDGTQFIPSAYTSLKKWKLALGKAVAGVKNARICFVGDSTTAGLATGTATFLQSPPIAAAKVLGRSLLTTNINSTFGDSTRNNPANGFTTYDPRIGGFASWNQSSFSTAGGNAFGNNTDTTQLTFTPVDAFDTLDVYSITNPGYGTWDLSIDAGGSLATVNNNATRVITKTTVSVALATHTVKITKQVAGSQVYIIGIACSNSTSKTIDIYNLGSGSTTSTDWIGVSGGIGNLSALQAYAPDLTVIDLGINDRRLGLYTSTFDSNLQTLVTAAKATGDAILCIPAPSSYSATAFTTAQNQADYNAAILRVAAANGCPVFNKELFFGSYTSGNALGYYYDSLHPNASGYSAVGAALAEMIRTV